MGAGGWVFMALIAVVLLGLLAAFIIWLMQDQRRRPHRDQYTVSGSASEILNRRLATGEISVQEYERLKASLATPAGPRPSPTEPPTAP
jgi:putative membrane protein